MIVISIIEPHQHLTNQHAVLQETSAEAECNTDHGGRGCTVAQPYLLYHTKWNVAVQSLLYYHWYMVLVWICSLDLLEHCKSFIFMTYARLTTSSQSCTARPNLLLDIRPRKFYVCMTCLSYITLHCFE